MAPSTVSAWVAPEATQRAALPICYAWDTWDERAVKGEVPERQGEAVRSRPRKEGVTGADQEGEESTNSRSSRREETRLEPRALTVPIRDGDRRPREADSSDPPCFRRSVAKPGTKLRTGRVGGKREEEVGYGKIKRARALSGRRRWDTEK
ncbi:hypothetical protein NDU88_002090 [Pleurodeles waltl]|uniref:Uncharacterized protein n=1 Tax=Pleurodeles waltl TaxID=8319 RepID=A0AAV7UUP7_PLEWA|nr:hypothetical protein NDU88_002090 [Pleurodeles waltl]